MESCVTFLLRPVLDCLSAREVQSRVAVQDVHGWRRFLMIIYAGIGQLFPPRNRYFLLVFHAIAARRRCFPNEIRPFVRLAATGSITLRSW